MKKGTFGIAVEGYPFIFLFASSALICSILDLSVFAFSFLLLTWFSCYFFRDPERISPNENDIAVSPADGRIVKIENIDSPFTGELCTCISIFMSLFSVHVNRMPISAQIKEIRYYPGKFFNASLDKSSKYNERCAYFIEGEEGKFVMIQIAGLIAQRIVSYVEVGDMLKKGERFGMIKFGSRVDFYMPKNFEPNVVVGEKVFAGQSIIGKLVK